ncbi:MAG TPA: circadian clock KaiB family protein [Bacteroidia bacterium]|jgi:circadian clock protein KaiB
MAGQKYIFRLFVSGMSVKSVRAIDNLQAILKEYSLENSELEIVDITLEPEMATRYQIFAIPTLMKISPLPIRTILGDLSDKKQVIKLLDLVN